MHVEYALVYSVLVFHLWISEKSAGDEVLVGSSELPDLTIYAGLDVAAEPRQFATRIEKVADGKKSELIRARTTWIESICSLQNGTS
jgi:hypothetical protein